MEPRERKPEEKAPESGGLGDARRISVEELKTLMDTGDRVVVLDSRSPDAWKSGTTQIPGSIRVPPDDAAKLAPKLPKEKTVVSYCT